MRRARLVALVVIALLSTVGVVSAERLDDASHGGRPLSTTLSGAEEVSSTGVVGVGDPDGTGFALLTLNQGQGEVCFEISVANITEPVTRAHVHRAPAGANGGIVINFVEAGQTPFSFLNGFASGCVPVDPALIKEIRQNPAGFYVNVHNTSFPAGAVRGQLGD